MTVLQVCKQHSEVSLSGIMGLGSTSAFLPVQVSVAPLGCKGAYQCCHAGLNGATPLCILYHAFANTVLRGRSDALQ